MADNPNDTDDEEGSSGADYSAEGFEDVDGDGNGVASNLGKGPAVAAPPGKTAMMAVAGVLLVGFLIYQLFFADGGEELPPPPVEQKIEAASVARADIPIPQIPIEPPAPPEPPVPPLPELPPVPELPPPPEGNPNVDFSAQGPTNEQQQLRLKSNIMLQAGESKPEQEAGDTNFISGMWSPQTQSGEDKYKSLAQRSVATHVGDLRKLILQGKIIHATLETAIETSLPGTLRAIVSRDIHAESGRDVLVPKGSRVIGNYNADVVRGQARLFIIWNRLIRPDGVDIELGSPAADEMGHAGITGYIDNRYFEIFSGALLTSAFTVGMAATAQSITGAESTTTTQNTDGSQTQNSDPTAAAIQQAVANMGNTAQTVLQGLLDLRPMITVDQGTPINIFVNRDLEFPDEVTTRVKLVQ